MLSFALPLPPKKHRIFINAKKIKPIVKKQIPI
jgi:hypothetical protein